MGNESRGTKSCTTGSGSTPQQIGFGSHSLLSMFSELYYCQSTVMYGY